MCVSVLLPECMYVYVLHTCLVPMEVRRVSDPLGLESQGVTDPREPICGCRKSSLGPLQEPVLSTPGLTVQPQPIHFLPCVCFKRFQISENVVENVFPPLNCLKDQLSIFV